MVKKPDQNTITQYDPIHCVIYVYLSLFKYIVYIKFIDTASDLVSKNKCLKQNL